MKRRQFIGATAVVCVGAFLPDVARGKTLVMPVDLNSVSYTHLTLPTIYSV